MAFAAFTTGGTFSGRGSGKALTAASSTFLALIVVTAVAEPWVSAGVVTNAELLTAELLPTGPPDGRFDAFGNSCRRTGSEPD